MSVARPVGARAFSAGLLLEVRALPMAAALLAALLGITWAGGALAPLPPGAPALLAAVFFGLYTAHLTDTFVDVVRRGDRTPAHYPLLFRDSTGLIPDRAYPGLIAGSALAAAAFSAAAALVGGPAVALALGAGLVVALSYAPLLDRTLPGVCFGYPTGVSAVFVSGYALAAPVPDAKVAALGAALFLALTGVKVRSDLIDLEDDARIGKRTVPVLWGPRRALALGYGLALAGVGLGGALPLLFPVTWLVAPVAAACALALASSIRLDPFRGSMVMAASLFGLLAGEVAVLAAA